MSASQPLTDETLNKEQRIEGKKGKGDKRNKQFKKFKALNYQKTDTVKFETFQGKKVSVETDKSFIESVQVICDQKQNIFKDLIQKKGNVLSDIECEEIHFKAKLHDRANIINFNSHRTKEVTRQDKALTSLLCKCGCNRFKGRKFPVCYDLQEINVLGSGVILFFHFMRHIIIGLLSFVLIYSIYALVINLRGSYVNQTNNISYCTSSYCFYRDQASVVNRMSGEHYTTALSYVGLLGMLVWQFIARIVLEKGRYKNHVIDKNLTSASDYAIKVNNLPYKQYNQEELLEYLQKISKKAEANRLKKQKNGELNRNGDDDDLDFEDKQQTEETENEDEFKQQDTRNNIAKQNKREGLDIKSIQIIYNMEFSRNMLTKIDQLCSKVSKQLTHKNDKYIIDDKEQYLKFKRELLETYELFQDLRKKFLNDSSFRKKISTRTAIIEFNSKRGKNIILSEFQSNKITIFKAFQQRLTAKFFGQNKTELIFKGQIPVFTRAPQPSDIIWNNCQKQQSVMRIFFIYIIAFIIILISFGLIVALEYFVINYLGLNKATSSSSQSSAQSKSVVSTILNIGTSIILQIINKFLWFSMFYLLNLEYNHTNTNKIVSQMSKTLFAMSINVIVLPIIVNYGFGNSIYGASGLAGIVFDYHISAVTINIVLQLINPIFIVLKVCLYIKRIRNFLIRSIYTKVEDENDSNNQMSMKKIYSLYQGLQFNIAQSYIFIITNMFHAFFFCELQPFIIILLLIEAFLFYWVCKIKILKMCKIPLLTQILIFQVSSYYLFIIPIFYGCGGIFVSYVGHALDPTKKFQFIAYSICVFVGLLNYINPKNILQNMIKSLIRCCDCLKSNQMRKHNKSNKTGNEKRESEIIEFNEMRNKQKRQENYFKESNTITLLGFQNKLLGASNFEDIEKQLKNYCSSHVANSKIQKGLKQISPILEQESQDHSKPRLLKTNHQEFI